jgi:CHAD domain-containing protein
MRVNARRLRAVTRAFSAILPEPVLEMEPELGWIASSLGAVRDADVFCERFPTAADAVSSLRQVRLDRLLTDFDSERFADLLLALRHRIAVRDYANSELAAAPVLAVGPDVIARRFRRLRSTDLDDAAMIHVLRKRAKRLRYTSDCFSDYYGKPLKRFTARLKSLQELLGAHQDSVVADEILSDLGGFDDLRAQESVRAAGLRAQVPEALDSLRRAWEPLRLRMNRDRRRLWSRR